MFGGPLLSLDLWAGYCCCLASDEDKNARQAFRFLNDVGVRILWKTGKTGGSRRLSSPKQFLSSFFGASNNENNDDKSVGSSNSSQRQDVPANKDDCLASLHVQDNADSGEPELYINPFPKQSITYKLNIALRRIDRVQMEDNDIVLLARPPKQSPSSSRGSAATKTPPPAKELLRFCILQNESLIPCSDEQRNLTFHHCSVLIEWERQRRRSLGLDQFDDLEEEDQPNFLTARAQKAAHFAKRELELQQTKRDREKRKQELLQASGGGMKYTALAMANSN